MIALDSKNKEEYSTYEIICTQFTESKVEWIGIAINSNIQDVREYKILKKKI